MPIRIPLNVELRLAELAREHPDWGAKRHAAALADEFPDTAPSERTVSSRLAVLRDRSGAWTLRPGEGDSSFVLETLAATAGPGNPLPRLTLDEVGWIRTIHASAPDLPPAAVLRWARLYLTAGRLREGALSKHVLDLYLAQRVEPFLTASGVVMSYVHDKEK